MPDNTTPLHNTGDLPQLFPDEPQLGGGVWSDVTETAPFFQQTAQQHEADTTLQPAPFTWPFPTTTTLSETNELDDFHFGIPLEALPFDSLMPIEPHEPRGEQPEDEEEETSEGEDEKEETSEDEDDEEETSEASEDEEDDEEETSEDEEEGSTSVSRIRRFAELEFSSTPIAVQGCPKKRPRTHRSPPIKQFGQNACQFAKQVIRWGAGNVLKSLRTSGNRSKVAFEEKRRMLLTSAARNRYHYKLAQARKAGTVAGKVKAIIMRAATAQKYRAGNCEEHADLTFYHLCTHASGIVIDYACGDEDHGYIIARDPHQPGGSGDSQHWTVIDPWPHVARVGAYHSLACQPLGHYEVNGILIQNDGVYHGDQRLFTRDEIRQIFQTTLTELPDPHYNVETLQFATPEQLRDRYHGFVPYAMDGEPSDEETNNAIDAYGGDSSDSDDEDFQSEDEEESDDEDFQSEDEEESDDEDFQSEGEEERY